MPNDIVEGCSEIENDITNNKPPISGNQLILLYRDLGQSMRFMLDNGVRLVLNETPNIVMKDVQVFLRPANLEPGAIQWFHKLYYDSKKRKTSKGHALHFASFVSLVLGPRSRRHPP